MADGPRYLLLYHLYSSKKNLITSCSNSKDIGRGCIRHSDLAQPCLISFLHKALPSWNLNPEQCHMAPVCATFFFLNTDSLNTYNAYNVCVVERENIARALRFPPCNHLTWQQSQNWWINCLIGFSRFASHSSGNHQSCTLDKTLQL